MSDRPRVLTGDPVIIVSGNLYRPNPPVWGTVIAIYMLPVEAGERPDSPKVTWSWGDRHLARGRHRLHTVGPYLDILLTEPVSWVPREHKDPHPSRGRHPMDPGPIDVKEDDGFGFSYTGSRTSFVYHVHHSAHWLRWPARETGIHAWGGRTV